MNPLDFCILLIIVYYLIMGLFRGIIRELVGLIGLVCAFLAASHYYSFIEKELVKWISNESLLNIGSFLSLFVVIFSSVSIIGIIINYLLKKSDMGWKERLIASGIATVKGILVNAAILVCFISFLETKSQIIEKSMFAPRIAVISEKVVSGAPKTLQSVFRKKYAALSNTGVHGKKPTSGKKNGAGQQKK